MYSLNDEINNQIDGNSTDYLPKNNNIKEKIEIIILQDNPTQFIKTDSVFLINEFVITNKAQRYDEDKKKKFNLEKLNKDYLIELKEQCKYLFS